MHTFEDLFGHAVSQQFTAFDSHTSTITRVSKAPYRFTTRLSRNGKGWSRRWRLGDLRLTGLNPVDGLIAVLIEVTRRQLSYEGVLQAKTEAVRRATGATL